MKGVCGQCATDSDCTSSDKPQCNPATLMCEPRSPRNPRVIGGGFSCSYDPGAAHSNGSWALLLFIGLLVLHRRGRSIAVFALIIAVPGLARADYSSFAVGRYSPSEAGEWSFWVDHPWYSNTRWFAGGLTLDYAHDPLVYRYDLGEKTTDVAVIEHQLFMHFDLAVALSDRFTLSLSLPLELVEDGTVTSLASPSRTATLGDPRLGMMIRLFGDSDESPISLHLGANVWFNIHDHGNSGDRSVRILPRLVLAGLGHHIRWSFTGGYLIRSDASVLPNAGVGSELQFGALIQYADLKNRFAVGPEAMLGTVVEHAFEGNWTSLELLLGFHYNVIKQIQTGVAVGIGLLSEPGTPDARVLFRLAYAPIRTPKPHPTSSTPTPTPTPTSGPGDRDHDGVLDQDDQCPDQPAGDHPDPKRPGCPLKDRDGDGVPDDVDQCPDVAAGRVPDPARAGCPANDRDGDGVLDSVDACPDKPGAPSTDPKKNGCPGLVEVKNGQLITLKPVYFASNRDVILPQSFPVLSAVADLLIKQTELKHLVVEGHTDSQGLAAMNLALSKRRAGSVMKYLVDHGVAAGRLSAEGYGPDRPIAPNDTIEGRAKNRRVEFHITDPASPNEEPPPPPPIP
jgi:outer membrane protein OmpA-like peptidoglycan-associated protein